MLKLFPFNTGRVAIRILHLCVGFSVYPRVRVFLSYLFPRSRVSNSHGLVTPILGMLWTFCYQSFEVAASWSRTPSISFVVGSLFISVSSLLGRKERRNGIGMLISGAEK